MNLLRGADGRRLCRVPAEDYEALMRSIQLLRESLSAAQRQQYDRFGFFDVCGGETGRRYRIRKGLQVNIQQLNGKGRPVCELCFVPGGSLVAGDVMLAQKLALELFERDALNVANKFPPTSPINGFLP